MFKEEIKITVNNTTSILKGEDFPDASIMAYGITNVLRKWHILTTKELNIIKDAAYKPITGFFAYTACRISDIACTNRFLHEIIGYSINNKGNTSNVTIKYIPDLQGGILVSETGSLIKIKDLHGKKVKKALILPIKEREKESIFSISYKEIEKIVIPQAKISELTNAYERLQIAISEIEDILSDKTSKFYFRIVGENLYIKKVSENIKDKITTIDISGGMVSTFSEAFILNNDIDKFVPLHNIETKIQSLNDLKGFVYAFYQRHPKTRNPKIEKKFLDAYENSLNGQDVSIFIKSVII